MHVGGIWGRNTRNPWGSLGVGTRGNPPGDIGGRCAKTRGELAVEVLEGIPLADGPDLCQSWAARFLDWLHSGPRP